MLTSVLCLTPLQIVCPMAAAPKRQIPLIPCSVHPSQSHTTHTPIPGTSPLFFPHPVLNLTLCPAVYQMIVPTPSKTSSPSQILILIPCCCPAFTLAATLIPVPHYNRTLTPSNNSLLGSHVGGPRWSLLPPSVFRTQKETSQYCVLALCFPLTPIHPVEHQVSL